MDSHKGNKNNVQEMGAQQRQQKRIEIHSFCILRKLPDTVLLLLFDYVSYPKRPPQQNTRFTNVGIARAPGSPKT